MKKAALLLIFLLMLANIPAASADDNDAYEYTANDKLTRSMMNIVTFYLEAPITIYNTSVEENPITGLLYGLPLGGAKSAHRLIMGIVELGTFPFPPYEPMIEPECLLFKRK